MSENIECKFVHLHNHSQYSLLDSPADPKELAIKAKSLGMDAMALTEHGNMMSYYTFYKACKEIGIKPILGVETYVLPDMKMMESDNKTIRETRYHLILLAKDNIGLQQLIKAVTESYTYQYKSSRSVFPRMTYELMRKHFTGGHVFCLSACLNGEIGQIILNGNRDELYRKIELYKNIFGKENYYLEIQNHGMPEEEKIRSVLGPLSKELNIGLVATNDCHYVNKEDAFKRDMITAIRFMKTVYDEKFQKNDGNLCVKSEDEMIALFPEYPEAIANTKKIADMCNVTISPTKHFPVFKVPDGYTESQYLEKLAKSNIKECYSDYDSWDGRKKQMFQNRLNYEFDVIHTLKYDGYLLIVQDFINRAKKIGMVGPGRGSAVGSLVCRLLKITSVDPLKYDLIFERFLNKERVSDPDIDTDFDPMHRDEVINYVRSKYGSDSVTHIITIGTLAARAAVRASGRVLGVPLDLVDTVAKLIPNKPGMTIKKSFDESPEFLREYNANPEVKDLVDKASMLEGLIVQTGVHAAGIIIADKPVSDYVPLMYDQKKQIWITQLAKEECEDLGLLKMDFLGLETLNIILRTLDDIRKNHGRTISLSSISLDDKNVLREIFAKGKTKAVFQFESAGMVQLLKRFQPQCLEDLILLNAAFRPGPIQYLDEIIDVKHGRKETTYIIPEMKEILSLTYGKPIYQEQIMQIFNKIAGYSLGISDIIRRAMAKKKKGEMDKYFPRLKESLIAKGASDDAAEDFCHQLVDFASYAFNKSHATAYAVTAYYTGWLKYYYPAEFMANVLNSANSKKLPVYLKECKTMGISVLAPSVNESGKMFTPTKNGAIRFGLAGIKNVGKSCEAIIEERNKKPFDDIFDFIHRMYNDANIRVIKSLILSGAFDGMKYNRNQMLNGFSDYKTLYKDMCKKLENPKSREKTKQSAVNKVNSFCFEDIPELSKDELLKYEMEFIGYYATGHPLDEYEKIIDEKASIMIGEIDEQCDGLDVFIVGRIAEFKKLYRRKDKAEMGSFVIEDLTGEIKCICFTRSYAKNKKNIKVNAIVKVMGRVSADVEQDEEGNIIHSDIQVIAEEITPIENRNQIYIVLESESMLPKLDHILHGFPGNSSVKVLINGHKGILVAKQKVRICEALKMICMCELGVYSISTKAA